jgi:hypothetical protein
MPLGPVALMIRHVLSRRQQSGDVQLHNPSIYTHNRKFRFTATRERLAKEAAASHPYTRWQAHQ